MSLATVTDCTVTGCSFNHDGCTAGAITMATRTPEPTCVTFISLDVVAGTKAPHASVGACQRADCVFNDNLLCTAEGVKVGDGADCLTFTAR